MVSLSILSLLFAGLLPLHLTLAVPGANGWDDSCETTEECLHKPGTPQPPPRMTCDRRTELFTYDFEHWKGGLESLDFLPQADKDACSLILQPRPGMVLADKPTVSDFSDENMWIFPYCQGVGEKVESREKPQIDSKVIVLSDHRRGTDNWFILKGIEDLGEPNPKLATEWQASGKSLVRADGSRVFEGEEEKELAKLKFPSPYKQALGLVEDSPLTPQAWVQFEQHFVYSSDMEGGKGRCVVHQ